MFSMVPPWRLHLGGRTGDCTGNGDCTGWILETNASVVLD